MITLINYNTDDNSDYNKDSYIDANDHDNNNINRDNNHNKNNYNNDNYDNRYHYHHHYNGNERKSLLHHKCLVTRYKLLRFRR